jgi:molybdopterin-binding protein
VKVDVYGQHITSVITIEAVRDLGLTVGSEVTAIIKADHVMLGVE